jgi:SAM-dependent methyltransferase
LAAVREPSSVDAPRSLNGVTVRENPFCDRAVATGYERWYESTGRHADRREKALLGKLLRLFPEAESAIEVGCGTGHFTRWFAARGLRTVGLDSSLAMLAEAHRLGTRMLVMGDAHRLPFSTRCCDLTVMITTLEFLPEPLWALEEALRIARCGLILGALNRRSRLGRRLQARGGPIWGSARLYTPTELNHLVVKALAGRPAALTCRATLWPLRSRDLPMPQRGFLGMAVRVWAEGRGTP